mgnify:CR=1 FL=1
MKEQTDEEIYSQRQGTNTEIYLACADDGTGLDITTGIPLKTFDEWLNS